MQRLARISYSVLRHRKHQCRTFFSTPGLLNSDPWPLPHTPEHMSSTVTPRSAGNPIPPLPRDNESLETLRARLVYQSRKRGTLECDLLLSTFADEYLAGMSREELKEYDQVCCIRPWYFFKKIADDLILDTSCSFLTSKTGTSTTGRQVIGRRLTNGKFLHC